MLWLLPVTRPPSVWALIVSVPVEFEIQKKLELHGAKAIREYGVGNFNEACREIVLRYTEEWKEFIERIDQIGHIKRYHSV